jgi:hypothetical protein
MNLRTRFTLRTGKTGASVDMLKLAWDVDEFGLGILNQYNSANSMENC